MPVMAEDFQSHVTWEEVNSASDNTIEVNLPNQDTKYYLYTYTKPDNYTEISQPITSLDFSSNVNQVLIEEQNIPGRGFITNTYATDNSNVDITADFVKNQSYSYYGEGIITNQEGAKLGNITGTFIGNSGTAIQNYGTINSIQGTFIGNNVLFDGKSSGITNIINWHHYYRDEYEYLNPINSWTLNIKSSNFINNIGYLGGAIDIETLICKRGDVFITNVEDSMFIGNIASQGGAISAHAEYPDNATSNIALNIKNSSFIGNVAVTKFSEWYGMGLSEDEDGNITYGGNCYQGGAIYSDINTNIIADNGITIFTGNYVQPYGEEKISQAIFMVDATLRLSAQNNGKIIMNDGISGSFVPNSVKYQYSRESDYINVYNIFDGRNNIIDSIRYTYSSKYDSGLKKDIVTYTIFNDDNTTKTIKYYWSSGTFHILDDDNNEIDSIKSDEWNFFLTGYIKPIRAFDRVYNLEITGDSTGIVEINNTVDAKEVVNVDGAYTPVDSDLKTPVDISLEKTNLYLGRDNVFDNNNLTLKSGFMSMVNNKAGISALNQMTITGDTNFAADVDIKNKEMDRFTANEYGKHSGNLNVIGMNILSDASENQDLTAVYFAEPGLKNNVTSGIGEVPQDKYQNFEVYTPIYKYNVSYDTENEYDGKGDGGYFLFTKGDKLITGGGETTSTGNPSDAFNPAVLSAPVSTVAATQATVNETFKYVFEHADAFTQFPSMERVSAIEANKYALSTDYNENLDLEEHNHGSLCVDHNNKAVWVRPYTTFESMSLKNGPKIDSITYGTLIGYDGDFQEMGHGWHRLGTTYIGYNGSQLSYGGNDTSMNGGLIGGTETFYKGNFWTAITATAGASVGETHTMYGKEDYTTLLAGIGAKTGYNFEFKEGKYILQPIMFMSYTFVNTFDYTNAAGVRINTDPAHSIQLNPSVRFISNTKNGWQPYASVGMVWNLMNESKVTANNVRLPEMSIKPYVEYGLGVQRNWKDRFTALGQAMVRNGGRTGIALTAGFRWAIGHDGDETNHVKVKSTVTGAAASPTVRTTIKQLKR